MSDSELREMMAALNAEFLATLSGRISTIDTLWSAIAAGGASAAQMDELILHVHKIAGSAETFGQAEVGRAAAAAEALLESCRGAGVIADEGLRAQVAQALEQLRHQTRNAQT